jgi:hypothetical protein
MYLEKDEACIYIKNGTTIGFRIGADCEEHWKVFNSKDNDTMGNDFGRTQWCESREEAIEAWNYDVEHSVKNNHKNYW